MSRNPLRSRALAYGILGALFVGSGCGGKGCSCSRPSASDEENEAVFTDVRMLAAGNEPRVALRVARWTGLRYRQVIEAGNSIGFEGQPPVISPLMSLTFDTEVVRGSADPLEERWDGGLVRMIDERSVILALSVRHDATPKPVLDAWNQSLLPMRGSSFRQRVTESAAIAFLESELVGGVLPPPELKKGIDGALDAQRRFPFRLPPVPVGAAASWRFSEEILVNGVRAMQVADMSLRSIDGDNAVVGIKLRQEAPRQEVPHPLVPGQRAVLEQFRGDGDGEMTIDRLTAVPIRSRLLVTARLTLSGEVQGTHHVATLIGISMATGQGTLLGEDAGSVAGQARPVQPEEP